MWRAGLEDLLGRVAGRFFRVEPRRRAAAYVRGLLAPLADKNGWTLAEACGDGTPDGMQRLLNAASWDVEELRDDMRAYVAQHFGQADGVLIVDETGFLKKGAKSAGVQRQYSGTAGRVENCQLGVFLAYTAGKNRALIDRELYLPKSWIADRDRCREAGIGDETEFATKAMLARGMIERALAAGVPASWTTADEAYGQDSKFRAWLEARRIGYVVAVPRNQTIPAVAGTSRADALVAQAPTGGVETPLIRAGRQRRAALRLGRGRTPCLRRHHTTRVGPMAAGAPLAHPQQQRRVRTGLLPVLRPGRNH